jgi:predicted Zn-dependent protease
VSKLDDEIEELKRNVRDITPQNIQRLRQLRTKGERPTAGKRIAKLENRMKELEIEVERLRSMVNHMMPDKSDDD